ncbi:hypothetical protein LB554_17550 [Mesorhizobium sp. CO1-1-11]|uniref:hypothetical protein n=1 Tax=Mesorhizobium sp. CO1-1-11 TaxID=2876636 RepID=UPI001CCCB64A|nr:hypothetical protein [Mesorhizobium sp. CO1-1-11]MBZ9725757.1 hypothetical protein [Mesorhizobium sp. CO1-1-11]
MRRTASAMMLLVIAGTAVNTVLYIEQQAQLNRDTYHKQNEQTERDQAEAASEIAGKCDVILPPLDTLGECLTNEMKAYLKNADTGKDAEAQVDMVYWARAVFWLSAGTAVLSILGLMVLVVSLRQTREAISIDREVGHAQVRAYLSIDVPDQSIKIDEDTVPVVKFDVVNRGASPARKVRYIAAVVRLSHPLPDDFGRLVVPHRGQTIPLITVPPNQKIGGEAIGDFKMHIVDFRKLLEDDAAERVYLMGTIFYEDTFRQPRETDFCLFANRSETVDVKGIIGVFHVASGWSASHVLNDAT